MTRKLYNPAEIEKKWQQVWEDRKIFAAHADLSSEHSEREGEAPAALPTEGATRAPGITPKRPKYYCLEMLPYPSGRIHMGHVRNYAIGDAIARYKWMRGFNVLHPMGWDAFGMPAENAAIQQRIHPAKWTNENIAYMRAQLKKIGLAYDWSRELSTCAPEYYRWEQWVFLQMVEKGLAFRKKSNVNWCATCQTVLANEQAEGGVCWRCDGPVELRSMEQWFFRFPEYAEVLLRDIDALTGWPERVRVMQQEWIGKSEGAVIRFPLEVAVPSPQSPAPSPIEVFTTRPDTLYGVTFLSLAWEHPIVAELTRGTPQEKAIAQFAKEVAGISHEDRLAGQFEKAGVFTGKYCLHPLTKERIPIYVANFVLMDYGTGAVMAVPAHDQRDFEFAKKYQLPIRVVIQPPPKADPPLAGEGDPLDPATLQSAYDGEGRMVHSGPFDGKTNVEGKHEVVKYLESNGCGTTSITYRLKDWCISRQRYWGTPIPIVYCDHCGVVPVRAADLPVILPHDAPLTGEGGSPLAKVTAFVQTKCPQCSGPARRETDTMDTFMESSWYFLRYCSPHYDKGPVDPTEANYWMPIDYYIGGIEHAVGHLLYCRFYMKVLRDLGILQFSPTNEPAVNLLTQGMVIKDGAKMSKSKGNVVDPDALIATYGADTARLFMLFAAPPERDLIWSDQGVEGLYRFLGRVWRLATDVIASPDGAKQSSDAVQRIIHKTIKRVTDDIERLHFNTAIAAIMEYINALQDLGPTKESVEILAKLLAPFAPHIAEEMWAELGHTETIARAAWPVADPQWLQEDEVCVIVQVNGKLRDKIMIPTGMADAEVKAKARTEKVARFLTQGTVAHTVYVPEKLVNFVVK